MSTAATQTPIPTATPSRKRRLACMLYEGVLLFGVLFLAAYLFDTLTQSRHALHLRTARQCWLLFVAALYFCWFWRHGGQTLAMKTWRIRLVNQLETMQPKTMQPETIQPATMALSWQQCLWRFVLASLCTVTGLGLLYSFFHPQQAWLQDKWSNTKLVVCPAPTLKHH